MNQIKSNANKQKLGFLSPIPYMLIINIFLKRYNYKAVERNLIALERFRKRKSA